MPTLRFTKRTIDALPHPERGQVLYRDEMLRGFGLRVGAQSKVFYVEGQVHQRTKRVTIGRADVMSVDAARKRAMSILSDMAEGMDPNAEKRREALEAITLGQAFDQFFVSRTSLAENTVDRYRRSCDLYLKDWRRRPLTETAAFRPFVIL
jgi:hypothetical protein